MKITITSRVDVGEVISLLIECDLPVSDISIVQPPQFIGIRDAHQLIAVVGLEAFEGVGLLRSLAVRSAVRGHHFGRELVAAVEAEALSRGIDTLYLLTQTAAGFFEKLGYFPVARASAPAAIQATAQFCGLCPSTSTFLAKRLARAATVGVSKPGPRAE